MAWRNLLEFRQEVPSMIMNEVAVRGLVLLGCGKMGVSDAGGLVA